MKKLCIALSVFCLTAFSLYGSEGGGGGEVGGGAGSNGREKRPKAAHGGTRPQPGRHRRTPSQGSGPETRVTTHGPVTKLPNGTLTFKRAGAGPLMSSLPGDPDYNSWNKHFNAGTQAAKK